MMGLQIGREFTQSVTIETPDGYKIRVDCLAPDYENEDVALNVTADKNVLIYRTEKPRTMDDRLREAGL